ncbi:MAG TPA: hypothetical protein VGR27_06055 [Longimicrobiaceae bacterium]|nr:hypothetical protein [Longimicrobiaceae bacterium]
MAERFGEQELREIEEYLGGGGTGGEEQVRHWLRSLVAEVRRLRAAEGEPQKMHGDALLHGSGTRHGEHEVR